MNLKLEHLEADLRKNFREVYLVSGDEPLLMQEAADAIRQAAKAAGYVERQVMYVEPGFDWRELVDSARSRSLFGDRKLVDLRMPGKPGRPGGKALADFLAVRDGDTALLLVTGALDAASKRTDWVKSLTAAGALVQIWPVRPPQLPAWLSGRLRRHGLTADEDTRQALADKVEGNLLAAAQEIERIALLRGGKGGALSVEEVLDKVGDSARFDTFSLMDAALAGDAKRVLRLLRGLRDEGVSELQINGLLLRDLRLLLDCAHQLEKGGRTPEQVVGALRIWPEKKSGLIRKALQRNRRADFERMQRTLLQLDRQSKGMAPGDPWQSLNFVLLKIAGIRLAVAD